MEARGWIYYWHKRASPNALGSAVLGVQELIQPGAERVLEMRQNQRAEGQDAGGSDESGRPGT